MMAYGYKWDSESETPDKLKEASITCTKEELDQLIEFLTNLRKEMRDMEDIEGEHWHYRDWCPKWTDSESDLIVVMKNKQ